ncbi:hypothetical protein [Bradyrhizobium elkanii]
MSVNPESIRILMSWNCTPQAAILVGLQFGQLVNFAANKFTPTDDQLTIMAEYLVRTTGMSIEEQLVKRGNRPFPGAAAPIPKNDGRIFGENSLAGIGRPKGRGNNMTRHMRELVFQAGENVGSDGKGTGGMLGYIMMLSKCFPQMYVTLLLRLLPQATHLEAEISVVGGGGINIVPIKAGTYIDPKDVAEMLENGAGRGEPPIIEGEAVEIKKKVEEG